MKNKTPLTRTLAAAIAKDLVEAATTTRNETWSEVAERVLQHALAELKGHNAGVATDLNRRPTAKTVKA
jgi:hypothetical protein